MATHPYARLKFRTVDPTVNEDTPSYEVGDIWINETSGEPFICVDNTNGAAVWVSLMGGGAFDLAAAILAATTANPNTDDLFVFRQDSSGAIRKVDGDGFINNFLHPNLLAYFADVIHSHGPGDNQIAHADLSGLSGDDHTQYTRHDLSTAANDFLVGSGSSSWIKKTLAETITILRTSLDSIFAPIAKGVTNGDSHNHVGGDGAALSVSSAIFSFLANSTVPASSTRYTAPGKGAPDATANNVPWAAAGTLSNLTVRLASTHPASGSGTLVCTLYVNSVATSLVVTIASGSGQGSYSNNVNTVAIAEGDLLRWELVNNAGGTSGQLAAITMKITSSVA